MLGDPHLQSYLFGETEDRPRPAAVGLGGQGAGVPTPLEESGDERDTDAKSLGDLTVGAFALIDRRRNTLPEIHRMGPMVSLLLLQGLAKKTLASLTIELFAQQPVSKPRRQTIEGDLLAQIPEDMIVPWKNLSRNPQLELSHL